jgi:thiol-disulfide isomerase/thioredoxin
MKLIVKYLIVLLIVFIIALLGWCIYTKININNEISKNKMELHPFYFEQIEGKKYSKSDILNFKGCVIINYFSPDCEHCQYMTKQIVKNIDRFSNTLIVMITNADSVATHNFIQQYHIKGLNKIIVLLDSKMEFINIFHPVTTPTFYIYKNGFLSKTIVGETKIEILKNAIR